MLLVLHILLTQSDHASLLSLSLSLYPCSKSPSSTTTLSAQATKTDLRSEQKQQQPKMSSPLRQEKRSFSWPGSLPSSERKLTSSFRPRLPAPSSVRGKTSLPSSTTSETKSYNVGQIRPKILTADKTPLWVSTTTHSPINAHSTTSRPMLSLGIVNPPHTTHAASLSATSVTVPSPVQSPFGASFIYQVTPAGVAAAAPQGAFGVRQPMFAPVLTVLPTGLMAAQSAAAMPPCQPILLSSPQKIGAPLLGQAVPAQQHTTARKDVHEPAEKIAVMSPEPATVLRRIAEPTTGQSIISMVFNEAASTIVPGGRTSPSRTLASIPFSEMTPAYAELKAFAEDFKTKRIRLGFTQGAVGQSLADKGYSNFAQSTISRFEQMQLSPTNAAAIKQVLEKWLQEAESPTSAHSSSGSGASSSMTTRKRKKRVVFTPHTRTSLDEFFKQNPRPNRQLIEAVAEQLELMPEEVRVWFCNKRQKQKQSQSMQVYPTSTAYDREATLSTTSSGTDSPTSFYEASQSTKRSTPSPKTGFTIEELSKSSASSSVNTSPVRLSPFLMSPSLPTGAQRGFPMILTPSASAGGLINMSRFVTTTAA